MRVSFAIVTVAATLGLQACGGGPGHGRGGPPGFGPGGPPGFGPPGGGGASRELQLRRFDANADGSVSRIEFDGVLNADYAGADTNSDGKLGAEEVRTFNGKQKATPDVSPILDWNADGAVSMDEFAAQWRTLFNRADADGNGVVTADELARPAFERERPPRGAPPGGRGGPPGGGRPGGGF